MIFIIILAVCALVSGWMYYSEFRGSWLSSPNDFVLGAFFGLLPGFVICFFVAVVVGATAHTAPTAVKITELHALQDGSATQGSFFLGTGSVDGTMKYRYLVEKDGGMAIDSVDAENAVLFDTGEKPRIEAYEDRFTNATVRFLFGNGSLFSATTYKIYVPKGAIKYEYNVDLR